MRFEAAAEHVYVALGLIGLEPGHPPVWDPGTTNCRPPTGDLIDITLEWEGDGKPRVAGAYDWLREVEYARTPPARPWVFAGSVRLEDETLAAGHSGVGVALVVPTFEPQRRAMGRSQCRRRPAHRHAGPTGAASGDGTPVQDRNERVG